MIRSWVLGNEAHENRNGVLLFILLCVKKYGGFYSKRVIFKRVNKRFIDAGYDGIEDINDPDTDLPVIMFNPSKNIGKPKTIQTGREALNEYFKAQKNKKSNKL